MVVLGSSWLLLCLAVPFYERVYSDGLGGEDRRGHVLIWADDAGMGAALAALATAAIALSRVARRSAHPAPSTAIMAIGLGVSACTLQRWLFGPEVSLWSADGATLALLAPIPMLLAAVVYISEDRYRVPAAPPASGSLVDQPG